MMLKLVFSLLFVGLMSTTACQNRQRLPDSLKGQAAVTDEEAAPDTCLRLQLFPNKMEYPVSERTQVEIVVSNHTDHVYGFAGGASRETDSLGRSVYNGNNDDYCVEHFRDGEWKPLERIRDQEFGHIVYEAHNAIHSGQAIVVRLNPFVPSVYRYPQGLYRIGLRFKNESRDAGDSAYLYSEFEIVASAGKP